MKSFIKKHIFFLVFPLLTLFISCSKDDATETFDSKDLIGTWNIADVTAEFLINGTDFVQWISNELGLSSIEAEQFRDIFEEGFTEGFTGTITFNDGGTYSADIGGESESGTWNLSGSTLTLIPSGSNDTPPVLTVITLTSTTAVVDFTESETEDIDEDGTDETISLNIRMTLTM